MREIKNELNEHTIHTQWKKKENFFSKKNSRSFPFIHIFLNVSSLRNFDIVVLFVVFFHFSRFFIFHNYHPVKHWMVESKTQEFFLFFFYTLSWSSKTKIFENSIHVVHHQHRQSLWWWCIEEVYWWTAWFGLCLAFFLIFFFLVVVMNPSKVNQREENIQPIKRTIKVKGEVCP